MSGAKDLLQIAIEYHKSNDGEGEYGCPGETCPGVQRLLRLLESARDNRLTHGDVIGLIERVVTGDGQQLENLSMSDDEWRAAVTDKLAYSVDVSIPLDDWLALVKIAREHKVARTS